MEEHTTTREHPHTQPTPELRHEPIDFLVERGQRGGYGWEIGASAPGHDVDTLLAVIRETDGKLRELYGPDASEPTGPRAA